MDRYSSDLSKTYRNMAFKWVRVFLGSERQLFLAHQLHHKGEWALKKLVMEFVFNMARLDIWARNCFCLDCLLLYKLDMQDPQESDC